MQCRHSNQRPCALRRRYSPRRLAPRTLAPCLLAAATLAALAAYAPAQIQFLDLARGWPIDQDATRAVAVGDIDGDGDPDVVFGNEGQSRLLLNDGRGRFTDATGTHLPQSLLRTRDVALGDVDGDGDLDLVLGNWWSYWSYDGPQTRLYRNDGAGVFVDATATNVPIDTDATDAVALGDVDGDGDLDLVIGNGAFGDPQQNRLYRNDGAGVFTDATATHLPARLDHTRDVALGDIDGDGDLDLVVGNGFLYQSPYTLTYGEQNRLLRNDGQGHFTDVTATQLPVDDDFTQAVALGDVDGDGDLDLVCGNTDSLFQSGQNRLYTNDGQGHFTDATAAQFPAVNDKTDGLAFGDVDGDGDLDLVAGNYFWAGQANRLFVNDGAGTFADATVLRLPMTGHNTADAALADLDGDGDLDLVCAAMPGGNILPGRNRLYTNLLRQLEAPRPYQIGQTWTLEAYVRHRQATAIDFALPVVSLAAAAVPVPPFGIAGVDPNLAIALPLIAIPQPQGVGALNLPVPVLSGLIGTPLYAQALLVSSALPPRLSNVVPDEYTALAAPTITSIQPDVAGPGTPVLVTGTDFLPGLTLSVGGNPTPIAAQTPTTLTFLMPSGSGCDVGIALANLGNSTAAAVMNRTPVVTSASSTLGPAVGGEPFLLSGQHLLGATVTFNGVPMPVTNQTATAIAGTTPPGVPGPAVIVVANTIGCATALPYAYDGTPTLTSIVPAVAAAGTPVTIHGTNFLSGLAVTLGGNPVALTAQTTTSATFTMPQAGGCDSTLAVANVGSAAATGTMNRTPVVGSVPFTQGPAAGGALFVVSGDNLLFSTVTFNGVPMTNVTNQTNTAIAGTTPPGVPGPAVVVIRNVAGCQTTTSYTYQ